MCGRPPRRTPRRKLSLPGKAASQPLWVSTFTGGRSRGQKAFRSDEVMESYVRQTTEAHSAPEVIIAWQGGEPTLMGLDFYRRAVEVAKRYRKPDTKVQHTIPTNGILLDREWCEFH